MKNVEDVKLEMKIGKKKVFKKELSSREWKDLKNHGQIGYSYEYKNTGKLYDDYTDDKIIIKIKYYNKELKKNVEIWINPWEGIESREKDTAERLKEDRACSKALKYSILRKDSFMNKKITEEGNEGNYI
mgnify:CR=1 FL=1